MRGLRWMMVLLVGVGTVLGSACARETPPASEGEGSAPANTSARAVSPPASAPSAPEASAPVAETPPVDDDPVEAARRLLREMAAAYRAAPTLVDRTVSRATVGGRPRPETRSAVFLGRGSDVRLVAPTSEVVVRDGIVSIAYQQFPGRYLRVPLEGDLITTMKRVLGSAGGPLAQYALRHDRPLEEVLATLVYGLPGTPRLSGYRRITDVDDRPLEQLTLISDVGSVAVNVDPETKLIARIEVEYKVPDVPVPNFTVTRRVEFAPEVRDELPEPIVFDPAGRTPYATTAGVQGVAGPASRDRMQVGPGDAAPEIVLATLDGEPVWPAEQHGSVVVLYFWAVWSRPGRDRMSVVQELADQAAGRSLPLAVLPVAITAGRVGEEQNGTLATALWSQGGYDLPILVDPKDAAARAFGIDGVPMAVVIDPAGRIFGVASGAEEITADGLLTMVTAAAAAGG